MPVLGSEVRADPVQLNRKLFRSTNHLHSPNDWRVKTREVYQKQNIFQMRDCVPFSHYRFCPPIRSRSRGPDQTSVSVAGLKSVFRMLESKVVGLEMRTPATSHLDVGHAG